MSKAVMNKVTDRLDGRKPNELRNITITRNYLKYPDGSVLIQCGDTKVICTATIEESVPNHRKGSGGGWISAEYSMIPGSTGDRSSRDNHLGKVKGRSIEIQRLVGRALRAVIDLEAMGEISVLIDADVIQADGGTRTASITGAYVALHDAFTKALKEGKVKKNPIKEFLAATSVGLVGGNKYLDLNYEEDSRADVDMNLAMTESGKFVEVQGTAEHMPFARKELDELLDLGAEGIKELVSIQHKVLGV
jgi:ribonuclease PH